MSDSDQIDPPAVDETVLQRAEDVSNAPPDSPVSEQPTVIGDSSSASAEAAAAGPLPVFEGYEILDELGRGGMGVVYKARDLELDRTVAIKMIIGGKFASDDDVRRFRIEAESAARLDHAGIVPIYDIGDSGGNHFFSMKFIDGGALSAQGARYRTDAGAAAELMIRVADAVQHAHERGVLHRDLKPANILIDEDGNPAVTDLGLAKRIDGDQNLTQTGVAMGTPGFMAPEQAQGRKDITTAADIFALGAILYWLQTGEPPFKGDTAVATLVSTMEDEIPSLRSINANADADLDLICRKAMHRDPEQRYRSAAAFANDLQAWLSGELLSVRAPTAISVASIWIRKNLRTVLGACITGIVCGVLVGGISVLERLRETTRRDHDLIQLGHDQQSWVSNFSAARHMSDGWAALQFLIIPGVATCAFLNVLFVRPQSREASIVSALTASLTAGVVAFLTGIGWQPMSVIAVERGSQDIELLANAVWLESDLERDLAQQALMQRYPGLAEMDQNTRQRLIFRKIKHDQDAGIMPGMWWGVGLATLFVTLPMMTTSILSGVAWLDGFRGWHWFGCTLERCVYCVIFFLVITFQLLLTPPALHLTVISLAVLVLALVVAMRGARWYWRVALSLTPILCIYVLQADMWTMAGSGSAAGLAATDAELRQRAVAMNRLVAHTHDPFIHYKAGIAWLSVGDEDEYRRHCRQLLSDFENAFRPEIASRLAKLSLLRPDLQNAGDLPTFYKLAELASGFESSALKNWFFLTRAISEQRQGHARATLKWNSRSRNAEDYSGYMVACTHIVDALAHLDLGDVAGAKRSLQLGREERDEIRKKSFSDGHDVGWVDWRVFLIFEKEVTARLSTAE